MEYLDIHTNIYYLSKRFTGGSWLALILGQRKTRTSLIQASEICSTCYPRKGVYFKIRASEIRTSEICASQRPPLLT